MCDKDCGWQGKGRKLWMRGEYLLKKMPIPADIKLRALNKHGTLIEISAHKLVLGMGSQTFCDMLYGPDAASISSGFFIPDYTAEVLRIVVEYLYTDRTPSLTVEWALDVLRCAEQLKVPELAVKCRAFVSDVISKSEEPEYPLLVWAKARELCDADLVRASKTWVISKASQILRNPTVITDMSQKMLHEFISSGFVLFNKDQVLVYRAVHRWALHRQAEEVSQGSPARSLRSILGATFEEIRLGLLSEKQIEDGPVKDGMLSAKELHRLREYKKRNQVVPGILFGSGRHDKPCTLAIVESPEDLMMQNELLNLVIEPFLEGVNDTVRKFDQLCAQRYPFDITVGGMLVIGSDAECGRSDPPLVLGPLVSVEKRAFSHDSAGTVALRWEKLPSIRGSQGKNGHWILDISIGKEMDELNGSCYSGVVFGRVRNFAEASDGLKFLFAVGRFNYAQNDNKKLLDSLNFVYG